MKKNLKKLFALLLVVVMVAAMFAGCANNAEKPAETVTPSEDTNTPAEDTNTPAEDTTPAEDATPVETRENKVIYGSSTEISGDLGNAWWTNNATDKMIRDLINDYDTVIFDQFGQMVMNATTAASIDQVHNDDGSITFTVKINEGLTYNNGEPITAADYVAYALVAYSPVTTEAGAKISAESVVGAAAYQAGETKELAGVRLLDPYTYSIQITPEKANYYFAMTYASLAPLYLPLYGGGVCSRCSDRQGRRQRRVSRRRRTDCRRRQRFPLRLRRPRCRWPVHDQEPRHRRSDRYA